MQSNSKNFALPETNISQVLNLVTFPNQLFSIRLANSCGRWSKAISIFLGFLKLSLSLRIQIYFFRLLSFRQWLSEPERLPKRANSNRSFRLWHGITTRQFLIWVSPMTLLKHRDKQRLLETGTS